MRSGNQIVNSSDKGGQQKGAIVIDNGGFIDLGEYEGDFVGNIDEQVLNLVDKFNSMRGSSSSSSLTSSSSSNIDKNNTSETCSHLGNPINIDTNNPDKLSYTLPKSLMANVARTVTTVTRHAPPADIDENALEVRCKVCCYYNPIKSPTCHACRCFLT